MEKPDPISISANWIPKWPGVQVEVTCSSQEVVTTPGRDGWGQKMKKKNKTKNGAFLWPSVVLHVVLRMFASPRFKGGV